MESGFANAFTVVFARTETVCRDKQSILQSLKSPMVNVWKWWSDGSDTIDLQMEMKIMKIKMKMVNVMWVQIKTEMLNGEAKCGGSVICESSLIFLSSRFSNSILNSVRGLSTTFTLSVFALTVAFASIENVIRLCSFFASTSLLSLLLSLFEFMLLYLL